MPCFQDWLFIAYKRVSLVEYLLLLGTLCAIMALGLEAGIGVGIVAAAVHFAYRLEGQRPWVGRRQYEEWALCMVVGGWRDVKSASSGVRCAADALLYCFQLCVVDALSGQALLLAPCCRRARHPPPPPHPPTPAVTPR